MPEIARAVARKELEGFIAQYKHFEPAIDPAFDQAGRVHDWRNHVPESVRRIWFELPLQARAMVWVMANDAADKEQWD